MMAMNFVRYDGCRVQHLLWGEFARLISRIAPNISRLYSILSGVSSTASGAKAFIDNINTLLCSQLVKHFKADTSLWILYKISDSSNEKLKIMICPSQFFSTRVIIAPIFFEVPIS